jgi:hypothetical protein
LAEVINTFTYRTFSDLENFDPRTLFQGYLKDFYFFRVIENVWEWSANSNKNDKIKISILKITNRKTVQNKKEFHIFIETNLLIEVDEIGSLLRKKLGSTIYFGEWIETSENNFAFKTKKKYTKRTPNKRFGVYGGQKE